MNVKKQVENLIEKKENLLNKYSFLKYNLSEIKNTKKNKQKRDIKGVKN